LKEEGKSKDQPKAQKKKLTVKNTNKSYLDMQAMMNKTLSASSKYDTTKSLKSSRYH
jgi:hypothetical protein